MSISLSHSLRSNDIEDHKDSDAVSDRATGVGVIEAASCIADITISCQTVTASPAQVESESECVDSAASVDDETHDKLLQHRYQHRHSITYVGILLLLLLIVYTVTEAYNLTKGDVDPLLSTDNIIALNDLSVTQSYFGLNSLAQNATHRTRIVYFILDGLRYDGLASNTALHQLLTQPWFAQDSLILRLRNQLPSISLPNWITLVTGCSPNFHGRTGNQLLDYIPLSSIFSTSLAYHLHNGISGESWWSQILRNQITPFQGDGTMVEDPITIPEESYLRGGSNAHSDAAWHHRLQAALYSSSVHWTTDTTRTTSTTNTPIVTYFDYDLFLAYYDDVDAQSHAFGGISSQTDTAITVKTQYIEETIQAIAAIDALNSQSTGLNYQTIFLITSDHGHVDVGGHGGDVSLVRNVPLIVYANHSHLADYKDTTNLFTSSSLAAAAADQSLDTAAPPATTTNAPYQTSTTSIATTISALLGIPVPRQSEGIFLQPLVSAFLSENATRLMLHYQDLYLQKQAFITALLEQFGQRQLLDPALFDREFNVQIAHAMQSPQQAIQYYQQQTLGMMNVFKLAKRQEVESALLSNLVSSCLLGLLTLITMSYVFHRYTCISPFLLFPVKWQALCTAAVSRIGKYCKYGCERIGCKHPSTTTLTTPYVFDPPSSLDLRNNRMYAASALLCILLWGGLMLTEFLLLFPRWYRPHSEWRWEFTLFNSSYDTYVLVIGFCVVAALIMCCVVSCLTFLTIQLSHRYSRTSDKASCRPLCRRIWSRMSPASSSSSRSSLNPQDNDNYLLFPVSIDDTHAAPLDSPHSHNTSSSSSPSFPTSTAYFLHYSIYWFYTLLLLFFISQYYHCVFIPQFSRIRYVTDDIWDGRFQSLCLAFMCLPALIYGLLWSIYLTRKTYAGILIQVKWQKNDDKSEQKNRRISSSSTSSRGSSHSKSSDSETRAYPRYQ